MYAVFHRTWWKHNPTYPNGREPHMGRKHYIARHVPTLEGARDIARVWNANHDPGKLSDKAEIEAE